MSDRYNVTDITPVYDIRCTIKVDMVTMRDGVKLHTDIFFPPEFSGKAPVLMLRSPYSRTTWFDLPNAECLEKNVIYIVQSTRGTGWSEGGVFDPVAKEFEITDAEDTFNWLAQQDFFNGTCLMYGASYPGWMQWSAAFTAHPVLAGIAPRVAPIYGCVGSARKGGGNFWNFATHWMLSMHHRRKYGYAGVPNYDDLKVDWAIPAENADLTAGYPENEPFRKFIAASRNPGKLLSASLGNFAKITVPAFISGGWFDGFREETITSFQLMKHSSATELARNATHLVVGPWEHSGLVNPDLFGEENDYRDLNPLQSKFLFNLAADRNADPLPQVPQVKYFMLGENRWYESSDWPPPEMRYTSLFLHGDGTITANKSGDSTPRSYISDPNDPVRYANGVPGVTGCYDCRKTEERSDVLVYTTGELGEDIRIAGEVKLQFTAKVDAPDTDFFVTLTEVESDGRSMLRIRGMVRARFRNTLDKEELLTPGEKASYEVVLGNVAACFRKGNRLRISIAGQDFPKFDRNAQSGKVPFTDTELFAARCTICHDSIAELQLPAV